MVEEYHKENKLQDVILCEDIETGYRECFHRFDVMGREELQEYDVSPYRKWSKQELDYIRECVKNNKTAYETYKNIGTPNRMQIPIRNIMKKIKEEMKDDK